MKYWDFDTIYRQAPASEPERQYYFIEKTREILQDKFNDDVISGEARKRYGKEKLDELLAKKQIGTFMIRTFGCPKV